MDAVAGGVEASIPVFIIDIPQVKKSMRMNFLARIQGGQAILTNFWWD